MLFFRFPFNWKTPLGYLIAFLIEYVAMCAEVCTFIPLLSFFIGTCWVVAAFAKDLTDQLTHLNYHGQTNQSHAELKGNFNKILQLYSDARQLSDQNYFEMPFFSN